MYPVPFFRMSDQGVTSFLNLRDCQALVPYRDLDLVAGLGIGRKGPCKWALVCCSGQYETPLCGLGACLRCISSEALLQVSCFSASMKPDD